MWCRDVLKIRKESFTGRIPALWNFWLGINIFRLDCWRKRVLGIVVKMYWNPIDVEGIKPKLYSVCRKWLVERGGVGT